MTQSLRRISATLLLALAAVAVVSKPVFADKHSLGTVLQRAGTYVTEFQRQLSRIIAEESYVQDVTRSW